MEEWHLMLLFFLGGLLVIMTTGMPLALCFIIVNVIAVLFFWGAETGLKQLTIGLFDSLTRFSLLPLPLFILMGEVMFHTGIAYHILDVLDKFLGRLPGRLGLLAVGTGALLSTLTGVSMGSVAVMGSLLVPEMEKRGYRKPMSLGPILGSGGLAIMIPPSGLAILVGAIGEISIARLLMGIIFPGLLMAVLYATYIIARCRLQPSIAPAYEVPPSSPLEALLATVRYILPLGLIIFLVVGVIFLGIATPSEAAATGAAGTFILAALYRGLTWEAVKKSLVGTLAITVMTYMIVVGAMVFGQLLAYSGAAKGLAEFIVGLPIAPIYIIIAMQVVLLILGCFMSLLAIIAIFLPIFMPVVNALGFDPVWFGVIFLLNCEMGVTSPPYGVSLFVMKRVAPPDTTMGDVYRAGLPFLGCDLIVMVLILVFPAMALWLPGIMR